MEPFNTEKKNTIELLPRHSPENHLPPPPLMSVGPPPINVKSHNLDKKNSKPVKPVIQPWIPPIQAYFLLFTMFSLDK